MAIANATGSVDRHIAHDIPRPEKTHGDGGRVRKAIWEQIKKLAELVGLDRPETRGKVVHFLPDHPACQSVVKTVGNCPVQPGLGAFAARTYHHVVALQEFL